MYIRMYVILKHLHYRANHLLVFQPSVLPGWPTWGTPAVHCGWHIWSCTPSQCLCSNHTTVCMPSSSTTCWSCTCVESQYDWAYKYQPCEHKLHLGNIFSPQKEYPLSINFRRLSIKFYISCNKLIVHYLKTRCS